MLLDHVFGIRFEATGTDRFVLHWQVLAYQRERRWRSNKVGTKLGQFFLNSGIAPVVSATVTVAVDAGQTQLVFAASIVRTPIGRIAQHRGFKRFPDL